MADIQSIRLRQLHGQLGDLVYELTRVQFSQSYGTVRWHPHINAYRCPKCMTICVDLAGIDKDQINVQVEPRRLLLRGERQAPEPDGTNRRALQVLAMEIDYGPFEREVILPDEVDPERVTAEQRNGFLWVYLPLRPHA
jgi:HSP20 family protein